MTDSSTSVNVSGDSTTKGHLQKWANYLKGYQKRYFVLKDGLLSYYRNSNEIEHCRGTLNLARATIHFEPDSLNFYIANSGSQTFHLRALNEQDRKRWLEKLNLEKSKALILEESDEDEDDEKLAPSKAEIQNTVRILSQKLDSLCTCRDLLNKSFPALQKSLNELESISPTSQGDLESLPSKSKALNERAALFRMTSNALIKACTDFAELSQSKGKQWQKIIKAEHEQRIELEKVVEQMAKQHRKLENDAIRVLSDVGTPPAVLHLATRSSEIESDDEEDFQDAVEIQDTDWQVVQSKKARSHSRTDSAVSVESFNCQTILNENVSNSAEKIAEANFLKKAKNSTIDAEGWTKIFISNSSSPKQRRTKIPDRPNYSLNLWSIMKNCIGKELTRIPMPVNFSEPLSMLQRLTEDYEYSELLDQAACCQDSCEQLVYVSAFTISSYANTATRTGKPFNPLLGETFEFDRREDLGWRSVAEQVSHHPPACAMYTEGRGWRAWQEFTMSSKFRGRYLQIIPLGIAHLEFPETGNHYTWRKVVTTVNNIIVGRLWVDNHGEMDITNHKTKDNCRLNYSAYSYFSSNPPRRVTGVITDSSNASRYVLRGFWDDYIEGAKVVNLNENKTKTVYETGPHKTIWKRRLFPELEKCYNMTKFSIEMNEPENNIAPTDSRNRPDQRAMEQGDWEDANKLKVQLEEKQRSKRKKLEGSNEISSNENNKEDWSPCWFKKTMDKTIDPNGSLIHMFTNEYWTCKEKQEWNRCPNIYLS